MARIVSITLDNGELLEQQRIALQQEKEHRSMNYGFHADLTPPEPGTDAQRKRIRFNFGNGWSATLVVCASGANRSHFAAVAAWPTADEEELELGEQEASPEEAIAFLAAIAAREPV